MRKLLLAAALLAACSTSVPPSNPYDAQNPDARAPVSVSVALASDDAGAQPGFVSCSQAMPTPCRVNLLLTADANPAVMQVSSDAAFPGATWAPVPTGPQPWIVPFDLPDGGDGPVAVHVRFRSVADNVSSTFSASIQRKSSAPTAPSIGFPSLVPDGGGAYHTNALPLPLSLLATGANRMRVSCDATQLLGNQPWLPYNPSQTCVLVAGDGDRQLEASFMDEAGNVSATATATVRLQQTPPAPPGLTIGAASGTDLGSRTLVTSASTARTSSLQFAVAVTPPGGALFSHLDASSSSFLPATIAPDATSVAFALAAGDAVSEATNLLTVRAVDKAGNVSLPATVSVVQEQPGGPAAATGLSFFTRPGSIQVSWTDSISRFNAGYQLAYGPTSGYGGAGADQGSSPISVGNPCDTAGSCRWVLTGLSDFQPEYLAVTSISELQAGGVASGGPVTPQPLGLAAIGTLPDRPAEPRDRGRRRPRLRRPARWAAARGPLAPGRAVAAREGAVQEPDPGRRQLERRGPVAVRLRRGGGRAVRVRRERRVGPGRAGLLRDEAPRHRGEPGPPGGRARAAVAARLPPRRRGVSVSDRHPERRRAARRRGRDVDDAVARERDDPDRRLRRLRRRRRVPGIDRGRGDDRLPRHLEQRERRRRERRGRDRRLAAHLDRGLGGQLRLRREPPRCGFGPRRLVYAMEGNASTLHVFDYTNPASPSEVGTAPGVPSGKFFVAGGDVYLASGNLVEVLNLATLSNPAVAGTFTLPFQVGSASAVAVSGTTVVVAGSSGLAVLQAAHLQYPQARGQAPSLGGLEGGARIEVRGRIAVVPGNGIALYDVGDPAAPRMVASNDGNFASGSDYVLGFGFAGGAALSGNLLFSAYGTQCNSGSGLVVFALGLPYSPSTPGPSAFPCAVARTPVVAAGCNPAPRYYGVSAHGGHLFAAKGGTPGSWALDVYDLAAFTPYATCAYGGGFAVGPAAAASFALAADPRDVQVHRGWAFVAEVDGLEILDVANPVAPVQKLRWGGLSGVSALAVRLGSCGASACYRIFLATSGGVRELTWAETGTTVVDRGFPAALGGATSVLSAHDAVVQGHASSGGLGFFDASTLPASFQSYSTPVPSGAVHAIGAAGRYVYANDNGSLVVQELQ